MSGAAVDTLPLGRFHEISLSTGDLDASVQFWLAQGWVRGPARPVWPHPYAVLSRSGVVVGLHQYRFPSPSITCVHPGIAAALEAHREVGMAIAFAKTGPVGINEFGFRDPHGHMVTLLEAASHDATDAAADDTVFLSLPADDPDLAGRFWALLGAEHGAPAPRGWPCHRLTAGGLPLAFHAPGLCDRPALVATMPASGGTARTLESPEGVLLAYPTA